MVSLQRAHLIGAFYDTGTVWPDSFDLQQAGAILIETDEVQAQDEDGTKSLDPAES